MAIELNKISFGDSFEMCELVEAKTVDLILEDMPYNTTACEWDVEIDLELYWKTRLRILKPTGAIVLTASQPFTSELVMSNKKMFKYEWIWNKKNCTGAYYAKVRPMQQHENILVFGRVNYIPQKEKIKNNDYRFSKTGRVRTANKKSLYGEEKAERLMESGERYPKTILDIANSNSLGKKHPTQKPVGLFEYLIRTYTNEGDLVFDGFGGSGTTAIAAHKAKRNFIVIEKERKYYDLSVERLKNEMAQLRLF